MASLLVRNQANVKKLFHFQQLNLTQFDFQIVQVTFFAKNSTRMDCHLCHPILHFCLITRLALKGLDN